jgi:hypothetical protein
MKDKALLLFWHEIDDTVADDAVSCRMLEWNSRDVSLDKGSVGDACFFDVFVGESQHFLVDWKLVSCRKRTIRSVEVNAHFGHVNSDSLSLRTDFARSENDIDAAATS